MSSEAVAYSNTFSWRANPPEENIIGYRLYYGSESRFDSNGNPKANFSYDHYIELSDAIVCDAQNDNGPCQALYPDEFSCSNLYSTSPNCTVSNLEGRLYFALTACSPSSESSYTNELQAGSTTTTTIALVPIQLLLLK